MVEAAETELTVAEAAAFAGVSDRTIRNWINEGNLSATNTPAGRKVRKDDVVGVLREKGYAPPELETIINLSDARAEREQRVVPEPEVTQTLPTPEPAQQPQLHPSPGTQLTPEVINVVLQPLVEQLNAANARAERKEQENLELAGRIGYLQAKVQQYEEQVKLLEAPKESPVAPPEALPLTQPPVAAPEPIPDAPARLPWYKRLFSTE